MKFFIFIFIFSLNCFSQFAPVSEIESGSISTVYRSMRICPNECMRIPVGFNSRFHKLVNEMIDDRERPVMSKTSIEQCSVVADDPETPEDESLTMRQDCESKLSSKSCGEEGGAIISEDFSEVYCSKLLRYRKKPSGKRVIEIDEDLKSSYEAEKLAKGSEERLINEKLRDMNFGRQVYAVVQVANRSKGLSKAQRRGLRNTLKEMRDDLFDGNICQVREDLQSLNADGTLIKESDKALITAKIDSYKSCN